MPILKKIFLVGVLLALSLTSANVYSWDDCPKDRECEYPGDCNLYIDTNDDGECDHGQEEPTENEETSNIQENIETTENTVTYTEDELMELVSGSELKTMTIKEVAELYNIDSHEFQEVLITEFGFENLDCSTSFADLHTQYHYEPSAIKAAAAKLAVNSSTTATTNIVIEENPGESENIDKAELVEKTEEKETSIMDSYYPYLLIFTTIGGYFITWLLVKFKKMKLPTHRKFWNVILLISFLISGLLGLLLTILIEEKEIVDWYRKILWIHVEFGVIMAVISIFHTWWHLSYYLRIFGLKKNKK